MYCVFIPKNEKNNDSITSIDTELAHHDINPYQHLKTVEVRSQEKGIDSVSKGLQQNPKSFSLKKSL